MPPIQVKFVKGDIIAKTASSADQVWMILKYDSLTEKYERTPIYKKPDGRWYRNNEKSEFTDRALTETIYPVKVGHISSVSLVPVETFTSVSQTTQGKNILSTPSTSSPQSLSKIYPVAQFTASPLQGQAPLTVQFTDLSDASGACSYAWDVNNDGKTEYSTQNPQHTYPASGIYTVKLTVTNSSGSDCETKTNYITLSSDQPIVPLGSGNFGAESNPTGNPLGGGTGYSQIIPETDSTVKYVTITKDQLITALKTAKSGEVVFVKGSAVIDLTGTASVTIPPGVTLASDRGLNGSSGGLIKRTRNLNGNYEEPMFIAGGDDVRVTGLRLQGEMYAQDYGNKNGETSQKYYLVGIYAENRKGFEVDNCELYGWAWATISLRGNTNTPIPYIHHNFIHHNQARGEGYGICMYGGKALIEANIFDYNRHDVTGAGMSGESYEVRYNHVLGNGNPIGASHFDVHQDEETGTGYAGNVYKIHHNTVEQSIPMAVGICAIPQTGVYIDHNIFKGSITDSEGGVPIFQVGGKGKMFVMNNYWNGELYNGDEIVWYLHQ
jgi:PKD repeat protein